MTEGSIDISNTYLGANVMKHLSSPRMKRNSLAV